MEELAAETQETISEVEKLSEQRKQLEASMAETQASLKEILSTATLVSSEDKEEDD